MRINIDMELWADERYEDLVELVRGKYGHTLDPRVVATGIIVHAIRLAWRFWKLEKLPIPKKNTERSKLPFDWLIECDLAEEREDGIYVRGIEEAFSWYFEAKESGRIGGLKSAKVRRERAKNRTPLQGAYPRVEGNYTYTYTDTDNDTLKNKNSLVLQKKKVVVKEPEVLDSRVCEVIEFLNDQAGKDFKPGTYQKILLTAMDTHGFSAADLKAVIKAKTGDPYFQANPKYLRPQTLFGSKAKIESYLNEGRALSKGELRSQANMAVVKEMFDGK